ncbi:hypothetical protein [Micromonospora wenchangensis]|uniref:hypothetical protein n=1 Tax=Micromonospora wenchangensis TaxID=1185415 RepID=UPI00380929A5
MAEAADPAGQMHHLTAHFDTPTQAHMWLDAVPAGWRVLASDMHDQRSTPDGKVVVDVTVIRDPFTVADVKGMFAAHGMSVEPIGRQTR